VNFLLNGSLKKEVIMRKSILVIALTSLLVTPAFADPTAISRDEAQIQTDKAALAADRDRLQQASKQLQADRNKMTADERILEKDKEAANPGGKPNFWNKFTKSQHGAKPAAPVKPGQAAPAMQNQPASPAAAAPEAPAPQAAPEPAPVAEEPANQAPPPPPGG
jgi:hypothetical protein